MTARVLLAIDPENGEATLIDLLKTSQSDSARESIIEALAGRRAEPVIAAIVSALRDRSTDVRFRACLAVKKLGPSAKSATDNLTYLVQNDRSFILRSAAADALAAIHPENLQLLISNPGLRRP